MRVLIAGCGFLGRELAAQLVARGDMAFGLARQPTGLPAGTVPLAADLTDPTTLGGLPEGLDAVVYAAAAGGYSDPQYRAAYVDGPRNLLGALSRQRRSPRRVIYVSSTGVYSQSHGEWVDETSPAEPRHFSGQRMIEGEAVVREGPSPAIVLRLAGIYGPGRTLYIDRVRNGSARLPPRGAWTNRIHRDDAAGAILHLLEFAVPDPLYLGVDDEPSELADVLRWIARKLSLPDPPPEQEPPGNGPTRERSSKRCSNRRLAGSGYRFRFPTYREGYGALLEDPGRTL